MVRLLRSSSRSRRGATLAEFALAFPVILLCIWAIIFFSVYFTARSMVATGANRALSLAAVIDGLDDLADTNYATAKGSVETRARALAEGTLFKADGSGFARITGVRLVMPDDVFDARYNTHPVSPRPSHKEGLRQFPMQVVIQAQVSTLVPLFPNVTFEVRAIGFREPHRSSSLPVGYDCTGTPLGSGPLPNATACICAGLGIIPVPTCRSHEIFDGPTCKCNCASGYVPLTSGAGCGCNAATPVDNNGNAACPNSNPCSGGKIQDVRHCCACVCPSGETDIGGVCGCANTCTGAQVPVMPDCHCACPPSSCRADQVPDLSTCGCKCPGNRQESNGACSCTNSCPAGQHVDTSNANCPCVCDSQQTCTSPEIPDPTTCGCKCPGSQTRQGGQCVCANSCTAPLVPVGTACTCACPTSCSGGQVQDAQCNCACPGSQTLQGGVCKCPANTCGAGRSPTGTDCSCACTTVNCSGGRTQNMSTCACDCPAGKSWNGSQCVCGSVPCAGGTVDSSCNCRCPSPKVNSGGVCRCPNTCADPLSTQDSLCNCICPDGMRIGAGGMCEWIKKN